MTENELKYWAFLSYCREDNGGPCPGKLEASRLQWGNWLHDTLKTFPVPADFVGHVNARGEMVPERIDAIFRDEVELPDEAGLSGVAREALEQSRCLIVICSPRSAKSLHVNEVVRSFKQLGRGNRILPIVIAGEPNAGAARQPGLFLDEECFVPAMRHPVMSDGTLDTTRPERGYIFADARYGEDKREILAKDFQTAEAELERAKIQLIAGLIGVGFIGLWQREQKRRFAGFAEAQSQIQEAWQQARTAQKEAGEKQRQVHELQNEARAAESRVLEAQRQLEEARQQVRDAQNKVLEIQNLPPDVKSQIQEAQHQAMEAQNRVQQLQNQVRTAENQLEQARNQARDAQSQVEAARKEAQEAQAQVQEIRDQTRDVQGQVEKAKTESRYAQEQVQAIQNKSQVARRLTRVYAVLAVLAIMAAGITTGIAVKQRKVAHQTRVELKAAEAGEFHLPPGNVDPEQVRQMLLKIGGTQQGANRLRSLDGLAAQIPQEQLFQTLNLAEDILTGPQRRYFQTRLLDNWMKTDLPAAFAWAGQLTNAESREFALEKIVPVMAAADPTNTLAQLNELSPAPGGPIYMLLFKNWAAQDPVQAIEQRRLHPNRDTDDRMLSLILKVWGEQKPEAALNWLSNPTNSVSLPARDWRDTAIADLFRDWATNDLDAARTACQQLPEGPAKAMAGEYVLSQSIAKSPVAASEQITNLPAGDFRQKEIAELCSQWGGTDAPAALAWAESLPGENDRDVAVHQVLVSWVRADLPAVTNWVASLPAERKVAALLTLTAPWAQQDAKSLADYALAMPASEVQSQCLVAACGDLASNDFVGTMDLWQPLTNSVLRQTLVGQAARSCGVSQREPAAKYIAAMPAGDDQQAAIKGLLTRWTNDDPASALNWLCTFPEPNAQPEQMQSVIKAWSLHEPAAAAKWLANLPSGTASEAILSAFLDGATVRYPEFAAQWTQSMTNEAQRQKYQVQVARQWLEADRSAATNWINTLALPEEIKEPLIAPLP